MLRCCLPPYPDNTAIFKNVEHITACVKCSPVNSLALKKTHPNEPLRSKAQISAISTAVMPSYTTDFCQRWLKTLDKTQSKLKLLPQVKWLPSLKNPDGFQSLLTTSTLIAHDTDTAAFSHPLPSPPLCRRPRKPQASESQVSPCSPHKLLWCHDESKKTKGKAKEEPL